MKRNNLYIFVIIIVIGIMLMMSEYYKNKKNKIYNDFNNQLLLLNSIPEVKEEKGETIVNEELKKEIKAEANNYYIGMLNIPKLGFNRGFLNINHQANTIEKNIEIIKGSSLPNVANHNLIIAGHSGAGPIAFFKDLYKLNKNDILIINYKGFKYTYKINNIYLQKRTGRVGIFKDPNKSALTLITCTINDKAHQTIYIAYLNSVQRI